MKVLAENIQAQSVRYANSCFFTMVAVDENGRPKAVPALQLQTEDELRRFAEAQMCKQARASA